MALHILNVTEATAPSEPKIEMLEQSGQEEQREQRRRWFLRLSFRGTDFCGWQRQPKGRSVQQTLEEALATVMRREVPIVGAGRTDAGVHAKCMFAHFDTLNGEIEPATLLRSLSRLTGRDIAVDSILPVSADAHARFDATARTYRYFISYEKNPFLQGLATREYNPLDMVAMNRAAELLLRTDDFTSFAKLHSDARTNICRVSEAFWSPLETDEEVRIPSSGIIFTITADRFLRNMVRAVVGTLVEVGRGKLDIDGFRRIIADKNRCAAGQSMPADGLYLWDVKYPDKIWQ